MDTNAKILLLAVSLLMMLGVVMIYSSSAVYAHDTYGDSLYLVKKHLFFMFLGIIAAVGCMLLPTGFIRDNSRLFLLVAFFILVAVLIPSIGCLSGGARRWLRIGSIGFQPSEFAKIALIIYLAEFTSRNRYKMGRLLEGFIPPFLVIGMMSALILLEPDLGTSILVCTVGMGLLFISGVKIKYLMAIIMAAVPTLILAISCAPYRMRRIVSFLKPWEDPKGAGFQLIQSFIALGSGGSTGVGLGGSKQKLFYLPQSHTDFIYSIVGEELGFIGALSVLLLFCVLVWNALRLSYKLKEMFMSNVVFGLSTMIGFEAIVNMGVSMGALPTKGLPLPFISYGGSSLVAHIAAIGLMLNMSRGVEDR